MVSHGGVTEAVAKDIELIGERDPSLAASGLAALALAMAREIDSSRNSATSKAYCAQRLQEALKLLRELAPAKKAASPLDEIRARREKRLARIADSEA